ncbi:MAG: 7TM diverse intracellular signaling domain-containing protein, partial [Leptospirales bacterium]
MRDRTVWRIAGGLFLACSPLWLFACAPAGEPASDDPAAPVGRTLVLPSGDQSGTVLPGRFLDYFESAPGARESGAAPPWRQAALDNRIAWRPSNVDYPNPGMTSRSFWFRLRLESPVERERWLYFPHSFDELDVFARTDSTENEAQLLCAVGRRDVPLRTRRPACRLTIAAGSSIYYIRVRNQDSLWLPAQILTAAAYHQRLEAENLLYGAYFGVLWIMALYNFLVYLRTREVSFLPYVAFTAANIAYFFVQSGFAAYLFYPDRPGLQHLIAPGTAALFGATACAFAASFLRLRSRSPRLFSVLLGAQIALGILWFCVILGPSAEVAAGKLLGGLSFGICLFLPLIAVHSYRTGYSPARIYLAAVLVFFIGGALFIARIFGWLPANWLTMYAFPAGSLVQVALFSLALTGRIEDLQRAVTGSLKDLRSAHRKVARSEERYRQLVEGSNDLIFVLSADGLVHQVNAAIQPLLGIRAAHLIGRPLAAVLYAPPESESAGDYQQALLKAKIQELRDGGALRFPLRLANRLGQPVDMDFSLERVADPEAGTGEGDVAYAAARDSRPEAEPDSEDAGSLILGRATPPDRNVLVKGLESEEGVFTIGNFLSDADALYHRVTVFLERYFEAGDAEMIIFALREIIMNAIEHGNLAISFDEKTRAQEEGR